MFLQLIAPETIEDLPQIRTSLKIIKLWSFLLAHTWRRYLAMGYNGYIAVTEFTNLYLNENSIDNLVRSFYVSVLIFNTILRAILLCWRRVYYENFLEEFRVLYVELLQFQDSTITEMLRSTNKLTIRWSKINIVIGVVCVTSFLMNPIFINEKVLPVDIYVPHIDKYRSPYYEILFGLQILMSPTGISMYIPFTNLFVAFILFGILMAKVLQYKLHCLNTMPKHLVHNELIWCIKYQVKFMHFVKVINELATYLHLVEFILIGAMLCVMLFFFVIVESLSQQIFIILCALMTLAQSVVLYFCANELYVQSLAIAAAAYDCNWFDFDVETQKYLRFFLQRAQKPSAVLVGNIYPMNLELLQVLLNVTYRYFTLLKRLYG